MYAEIVYIRSAVVDRIINTKDYIMSRKSNVAQQIEEPVATEVVTGTEETKVETSTEEVVDSTDDFNLSNEVDVMKAGEAFLIEHFGSKSKAIRGLSALGHKCGPISRALNIRFQHARNVLNKPLKRLIKAEREAAKLGVDHELDHE